VKANGHPGVLFTSLNQVAIIYYSSSSYLLNTLPTNAVIQLTQAASLGNSVTFTPNTNQNSKIFTAASLVCTLLNQNLHACFSPAREFSS